MNNIEKILNELYIIDPSFKSQEGEIKNIIQELLKSKPEIKIDENFKPVANRDDDEDIEISFVSREKINQMILDGEIQDEGLLVGMSVLNSYTK